jgi:DNA-binding CsgD family transcriptional regulator
MLSMPSGLSKLAAQPVPRRLEPTLLLVLQGARNRAIAERLSLAAHTVDNYVSELLALFGCRSRAELIVLFARALPSFVEPLPATRSR